MPQQHVPPQEQNIDFKPEEDFVKDKVDLTVEQAKPKPEQHQGHIPQHEPKLEQPQDHLQLLIVSVKEVQEQELLLQIVWHVVLLKDIDV